MGTTPQCHRFASAMLLPAEAYSRELVSPTLNSFLTLKARWKSSIAGQIVRCEQLGIFTQESARRMWINLNRRDWRTEEPLDDRLSMEVPRLLQRSVKLIVDSGLKTKSQILADLCFNAKDVEVLMCLPEDFFEDQHSEILSPRLKSNTVIQFPAKGKLDCRVPPRRRRLLRDSRTLPIRQRSRPC